MHGCVRNIPGILTRDLSWRLLGLLYFQGYHTAVPSGYLRQLPLDALHMLLHFGTLLSGEVSAIMKREQRDGCGDPSMHCRAGDEMSPKVFRDGMHSSNPVRVVLIFTYSRATILRSCC